MQMKISKGWFLILVALLVISVPAAGFGQDKKPVDVGCLFDLSSAVAMVAKSHQTGALMAAEDVNAAGGVLGRPLRLQIQDTGGKVEQAVSHAQKYIDQRVVALVGTALSGEALAIIPLVKEAKIPFFVAGAASVKVSDPPQPYIFQMVMNDYEMALAWLTLPQKLGYKKVGVLYGNYGWGIDTNENIVKNASKFGVTVTSASLAAGATDATVPLSKLKAENVEMVMAGLYTTENTALFNGLKALSWKVPVVSTYGCVPPDKGAIEGSYWSVYTDTNRADIQQMNARATAKYGADAFDPFMGNVQQAYDAIKLLAWAINKAGSLDGEAISKAVETAKGFPATLGSQGFTLDYSPTDHKGLTGDHVAFVQIVNGKPAPLKLK